VKRTLVIGKGRIGLAISNSLLNSQMEVHSISSRSNLTQSLAELSLELSNFDIVIWAARDAGLPGNLSNCSEFYYDLLKLIAITSWSGYFVFTSSSGEIYGEVNTSGALESDATAPISKYGHLKAVHEKMLMVLAQKNSFRLLILRISNVYQLDLSDPGVVGAILRSVLQGELLELSGGYQTRDFISLSDLAIATTRLIALEKTGVFNVASGNSISVNELVSILESKSQKLIGRRKILDFKGICNSYISNLKLCQALDWAPKSFAEHLEENYPYG